MTDETRPETTQPAPDGNTPEPERTDDALESWFRPVRTAERKQPGAAEAEAEVAGDAEAAPASPESASEPERGLEPTSPMVPEKADSADGGEGPESEQPGLADGANTAGRAEQATSADEGAAENADESLGSPLTDDWSTDRPAPANDRTEVIPAASGGTAGGPDGAENDRTQVFPVTPSVPVGSADPVAAAPTQAIPRAMEPQSESQSQSRLAGAGMAVRPATSVGAEGSESRTGAGAWGLEPGGSGERSGTEKWGLEPGGSEGLSGAEDSEKWGSVSAGAERRGSGDGAGGGDGDTGGGDAKAGGGAGHGDGDTGEGVGSGVGGAAWSPAPGPQPQYEETPQRGDEAWQPPQYEGTAQQPAQPYQPKTQPYQAPGGIASILPPRGNDDDDDFDNYGFADAAANRPRGRLRRALIATASVVVLVVAVAAALAFTGKIKVLGIGGPAPVPTVGFSPSGTDAGSDATQTGTAFLTDWENGNLKAAANITDNQSAALAALTAYKKDLKVSGLTLSPGIATAQGWMTFSVTAQVGSPSSAWAYSSGMATYSSTIDGYTRWFVKWQPSLLFTSLKSGQKVTLGAIPPVADKVVDSHGTQITNANAPSLNGIVKALEQAAPPAAGTPGQEVEVVNADGSVASKVAEVTKPVATGAIKTTIDLDLEAKAQAAVMKAPNSSMVVLQPSTGDVLAVANNPTNGLDNAMVGHYAPGSTFKTITTTLVLNKGVITDLNQPWDCPQTLNADGITLHNSEQESGVGKSFLWDFAQSCNNAFSRFEGKVSRTDLASTAHDYFGFNQKWDVGLGVPTTYGNVPDNSANSLAEELVGQDQITASPLSMASVAATIANGSFKQPILMPGVKQVTATPIPAKTDQDLKTLMHQVMVDGTLGGLFQGEPGVYGKTGTAEVQGKQPNSWTVAFKGDYAVAALAIGGGFGASTAGPEVKSVLDTVH